MKDHQIGRIVAIGIISILALALLYALAPYYNAFFGSVILFVLLRPLYLRMNKRMSKRWAATLTMIFGLLVILIPLIIATSLVVQEIGPVLRAGNVLAQQAQTFSESLPVDVGRAIDDLVTSFIGAVRSIVLNAVSGFTHFVINMVILSFLLFYLLINSAKLNKTIIELIPFGKKNARKLVQEWSNVTYSVVITTGLIAIIQGLLIGIGFAIAGIPGPVLWGFIAAILSFLPIVGPTLIWIPAGIISLTQQDYFAGIFILIWGFLASQSDNITRPKFQQHVGKIHPLISIIGIFAGLSLFGVIGVIIGPLLLSYFFLTIKMFKEEYLE